MRRIPLGELTLSSDLNPLLKHINSTKAIPMTAPASEEASNQMKSEYNDNSITITHKLNTNDSIIEEARPITFALAGINHKIDNKKSSIFNQEAALSDERVNEEEDRTPCKS